MYVAVKGGERAIENAHRLLAHERRGDRDVAEVSLAQISEQLSLGVDRVMTVSVVDCDVPATSLMNRSPATTARFSMGQYLLAAVVRV